jgi:hypothetical protein
MIAKAAEKGAQRLLRPCKGASPTFVPYASASVPASPFSRPSCASTADSSAVPSATPPSRPPLYEIVVGPTAPDAPPASLFGPDGVWHTLDLFEAVVPPPSDGDSGAPPGWVHRGRAGDWIKVVAGFVDTRCVPTPLPFFLASFCLLLFPPLPPVPPLSSGAYS